MSQSEQKAMAMMQDYVKKNRIRLGEFFRDFDKLHSGFVTREQFKRCLGIFKTLDIFNQSDIVNLLCDKYAHPNDSNRVNYSRFVDDVDAVFTLKHLEKNPTGDTSSPTFEHKRTNSLTPQQWNMFAEHQQAFTKETKSRGLILKEAFRDFDPHRTGRVTVAQFQRCFPFKTDQQTLDVYVRRYLDQSTGGVNYAHWVTDVDDAIRSSEAPLSQTQTRLRETAESNALSVETLLLELKRQVLANRIRVQDVFRDYDKLRSGIITEPQFASGLGTLKFQKFTLLPHHIALLCDFYRIGDGTAPKVMYTRFVDELESVFTEKNLEKTPLKNAPMGNEILKKVRNVLPQEEEDRAQKLLAQVSNIIRTKRLLLKPLFQDFDRANKGVYQTKYTTRTRFERVLTYAGITLSPADFKLLCDKYQIKGLNDEPSDNVSYSTFCEDVDDMYSTGPSSQLHSSLPSTTLAPSGPYIKPGKTGVLSIDEVEDDIQARCLANRVRIHEYFKDFDPLHSGLVTRGQFATALTITGMQLDEAELTLLYDKYQSRDKPGTVKWLDFADTIDEVFTLKRLEQSPQKATAAQAKILNKKAAEAQPNMTDDVQQILLKILKIVNARGILLPPFFRDFDKHNTGRLTPNQFKQVLSRHQFNLSEAEMQLLIDCYIDIRSRDVNYRRFVKDVDESESMSTRRIGEGEATRTATAADTFALRVEDADQLIRHIQAKAYKDRVRVKDFFADADRLRKGYITASKFRSGLDMAGFQFTETQHRLLEDRFQNPSVPNTVNYLQFCDVIEQVFTEKGLERDPMKSGTQQQLRMLVTNDLPSVDAATEKMALEVLEKIKTMCTMKRINPRPYFRDYDKIHKERVSHGQFHSVLDKLHPGLSQPEVNALTQYFGDGKGDVRYKPFCDIVD